MNTMQSALAVRMLLVGDVTAAQHPRGLQFLLERSLSELRRRDILFGNLEFSIVDKGTFDPSEHWAKGRSMKPEDAGALREAGFNVMSVANNHVMDCGPEGLRQTLQLLDAQGIQHCGGGRNLDEARTPAIVECDGVRVAVLAYTSVFAPSIRATNDRAGISGFEIDVAFKPHQRTFEAPGTPPTVLTSAKPEELRAMQSDVREAKAKADIVVVSWHWGVSLGYRSRVAYQMECGRAAIDAGASLVVGHHPHSPQGVEVYKKGAICYSLGDFAFWSSTPATRESHDRDSLLVECEVTKAGIQTVVLRPVRMNSEFQPEVVHDVDCTQALKTVVTDSEKLGTKFRTQADRLLVELPN